MLVQRGHAWSTKKKKKRRSNEMRQSDSCQTGIKRAPLFHKYTISAVPLIYAKLWQGARNECLLYRMRFYIYIYNVFTTSSYPLLKWVSESVSHHCNSNQITSFFFLSYLPTHLRKAADIPNRSVHLYVIYINALTAMLARQIVSSSH